MQSFDDQISMSNTPYPHPLHLRTLQAPTRLSFSLYQTPLPRDGKILCWSIHALWLHVAFVQHEAHAPPLVIFFSKF